MIRTPAALMCLALCLQCSTVPTLPEKAPPPPILVELSSLDPEVSAAAAKQIEALPETERTKLLLRGLQLEHRPAAVWCAARLEWDQVNAEEARLLVELLTPELFKPASETDVDFDTFRYNLSSDELGPILRRLGTAPVTVRKKREMFAQLHRQLRPEHYPILCDIYLKADVGVANAVMDTLSVAIMRTLRNKEVIGRVILRRRFNTKEHGKANYYGLSDLSEGLTPWQPNSNKKGYSSLLHELLKDFFTTSRMEKSHKRFKKWLFRWSLTETPANVDRPLLLDMLRSPSVEGRMTAAQGLFRLGGVETRKALEAWLEQNEPDEKGEDSGVFAYCLMAQDRGGDPNARKRLLEMARKDLLVVGYLAHHDLEAAVDIFCEPLKGIRSVDDAVQMAWHLDNLTECDLTGVAYFGSLLPDAFYDAVDRRLQASALPGAALARICQFLPNPSRRLVLECARRLLRSKSQEDYRALRRFFSALEVTDIGRLRTVLRRAVSQGNASACEPLVAVAEEQDVPALVRWLESAEDTGNAKWTDLWFSNHPKVRERIDQGCDGETLDSDCVLALGRYHGLPADFRWDFLEDAEYGREVVRLFRAGKPVDAILVVLEHQTRPWPLWHLGTLHDPRITALLRLAQERRYERSYWRATQELARQGDRASRRVVDSICRMGRYNWIDEISAEVALPTPDPERIRFWASELETNCCRAAEARQVLEKRISFFGRDDWWECPSALASIETCLRRCEGQLAWSRLAQKFVPVPQ